MTITVLCLASNRDTVVARLLALAAAARERKQVAEFCWTSGHEELSVYS